MEKKVIDKKEFPNFIQNLINAKKWEVVGVKSKEDKFAFAPLENASELRLDYDTTVLPPKKYFFPPEEDLLTFAPKDCASCKSLEDKTPRVVVGVHPYDLAAIGLMDKFFYDKELDTVYKNHRENTILIGSTPQTFYKHRFYGSMVKDESLVKYDLMLTDIGDKIFVEVGTDKGSSLLKDYSAATDASEGDMAKAKEAKTSVKDGQTLKMDVKELPTLLNKSQENAIWKEKAEKCFSCGSCVFVCPTCHCFDVKEDIDISLASGKRTRLWDGCMLKDFAVVVGDHNFRKTKEERYAHRLYKKGQYLFERYNQPGCVGCGRCVKACVPDIANPVEVYNNL